MSRQGFTLDADFDVVDGFFTTRPGGSTTDAIDGVVIRNGHGQAVAVVPPGISGLAYTLADSWELRLHGHGLSWGVEAVDADGSIVGSTTTALRPSSFRVVLDGIRAQLHRHLLDGEWTLRAERHAIARLDITPLYLTIETTPDAARLVADRAALLILLSATTLLAFRRLPSDSQPVFAH